MKKKKLMTILILSLILTYMGVSTLPSVMKMILLTKFDQLNQTSLYSESSECSECLLEPIPDLVCYVEQYCNSSINFNNSYEIMEASTEYLQQNLLIDTEFKELFNMANRWGYVNCIGKWIVRDKLLKNNTCFIGIRTNEEENDAIILLSLEIKDRDLRKSFLCSTKLDENNNTIVTIIDIENKMEFDLSKGEIIDLWNSTHHSCDFGTCWWECWGGIVGAFCSWVCTLVCLAGPKPCIICFATCIGGAALGCLIACLADPCKFGHICYPGTTSGSAYCDTWYDGAYHRLVYEVCAEDGQHWTWVTVECGAGYICDPSIPGCVPIAFLSPVAEAGVDQIVNEDQIVYFSSLGSSDPDGYITTYYWDFVDGGTYGPYPTHTYTQSGVYLVTLTVTDNDGLTGSDTMTVTVNNVPPIAVAGDDQEVIVGELVQFDGSGSIDTPSDLPLLNYYWDFGDGTTGIGIKPSHRYIEIGEYTATLTVIDDDGASSSDTLIVTVKPIPAIINIAPDTLNFKSKGKFITSYIEISNKDVSQIDLSSIRLNETIPAVTDLQYGFVSDPDIKDRDGDGFPELMVKFERATVQDLVDIWDIEDITLLLTGKMTVILSGTQYQLPFEGFDTIRVI
ncbi:MAG: PKD domain-containing protein [Candidatus Helarchaeota archaeon]